MTQDRSLRSFTIGERYDVAVRMVRIALAREGLRVPAELDVTARLRQELGAMVAPSLVLYVDDPTLLLEAVVFNGGAGLLIPQPLVVCGGNHHTRAILRNPDRCGSDIPETVRDPVLTLQLRMTRALETIADRQDAELSAALP
jgi:uncharacterized protein (DUF302 family)